MSKAKYILGFLWSAPMSVFGWLLGLFLLLAWQVESIEVQEDWTFVWDLKNWGWFQKKTMEGRGWAGFSLGNNVFIKDIVSKRWKRTLAHEVAHCHQWYRLGILFPLVYILECVRLYIFKKELHSYYDNRFEVEARKCAGQPVKIPRTSWKDGPNDRWAWW